ncbi:hypothetical protein NWE60_00340 [Mycoplasmopsis felis]|nr:hypothetical protein [Mycoplasmopsis felis]WAM01138.1 hypothetical protein NWE60_00340 [Mycoplasmopsis felis]
MTNMDNSLKELFKKSITALDNYLKRLKDTNKLPNQDKNISSFMQTTDYFSAAKEKIIQQEIIYEMLRIYILEVILVQIMVLCGL